MENEERSCIDCKIEAPETNTEYTLISTQAWRLVRRQLSDVNFVFEWRCPTCWKKYKLRTGATSGAVQRPVLPPDDHAKTPSPRDVAAAPDRTPELRSKPPKPSR